jgi:hypothetical protein
MKTTPTSYYNPQGICVAKGGRGMSLRDISNDVFCPLYLIKNFVRDKREVVCQKCQFLSDIFS